MCNFLDSYDFSPLLSSEDVNESFTHFERIVNGCFDQFCPVKFKRLSYKSLLKPWVDNEVRSVLKRRDNYYKLYKGGRMNKETYSVIRNQVTALLRRKKGNTLNINLMIFEMILKGLGHLSMVSLSLILRSEEVK